MEYLLTLLKAVAFQLIGVLGIFFFFGFLLSKLQEHTQRNYHRSVGWKGILWTAWIGTPIHELGHVFFAKIFHHKINEVQIFRPNEQTGGLGHVNHSYNKHSWYQKIGNFFIGGAPMIFGSIILSLMLYYLLPNGKEIFIPLTAEVGSVLTFLNSLKITFLNLFAWENLSTWHFWLFLYISFCIASHIAPSKQDREGMWKGFVWIIILLFIVNGVAIGLGSDITGYVLGINQYLGIFVAIFSYATIISLLHLILSTIIFYPFKKH